ncbi:hypothetical protein, partial [Lactiplantibacillus plantarum]
VASLKVIHARNPSFLGTQYTKIKSARKICTRTHFISLDISISILKNKKECWKKNPKDFPPTLNIIEP